MVTALVTVVVPVPVEALPLPPDVAFTSAAPDTSPAKKVVVATPLRVCASTGSTRPRLVVKRTVVPFCTGVPPGSITWAESSVEPPVGSVRVGAVSVTVELAGRGQRDLVAGHGQHGGEAEGHNSSGRCESSSACAHVVSDYQSA